MRDEIRPPNKIVWLIVGLIAFLIALLAALAPPSKTEQILPPFSLRLFIPPLPPKGFNLEVALRKMRQNPDKDIPLMLNLQTYYASQEKWEQALAIGERIVKLPEGSQEANAWLGIVYALVNLGRTNEAQEWVQRGLQEVHDRYGRAQLYRVEGDLKLLDYMKQKKSSVLYEAQKLYESAIKEHPQVPLAKANLAYVLFRRGETRSARALIEDVLNSSDVTLREKAIATYYLAQIEESEGDKEEATLLYEKSKQMHPDSFEM